ncbi:hypothetical protein TPAR_08140, partial [Tolypocladium paradoxum]
PKAATLQPALSSFNSNLSRDPAFAKSAKEFLDIAYFRPHPPVERDRSNATEPLHASTALHQAQASLILTCDAELDEPLRLDVLIAWSEA